MVRLFLKVKIFATIVIFFILIPSKLFSERVVGYYPSWVQNQFTIDQIDFSTFSHIIHAFAWPNNQGEILTYDGTFNSNFSNQVQSQGGKLLLSLGGGGQSGGFAAATSTAELRSYFITNIIEKINSYGYDGIDIDWEQPQNNNQTNNLNLFIIELDSALNELNPDLLLTMAVPVSNWAGQWYDFGTLNQFIDFFNAMTYDIHGSWSGHAGHNSPLFPSPPGDADGSVSTGINYLVNTRGLPVSKINMGIPFWGKKYQTSTINGFFSGDVVDMRYNEIIGLIDNGWNYNWDDVAKCPYLVKEDQSRIITYDNPLSIQYKCQYANESNLGGVMVWALGYDDLNSDESLTLAINNYWLEIDNDLVKIIPNNFELLSYPNPFNSSISIEFNVLISQNLNLTIFDIKGRMIESIFDRTIEKGEYKFFWKVKNEISSGVYFVILSGLDKIVSQKILYLK